MASNKGLVSKWYDKRSLNQLYLILNEGDLLEFDRLLNRHWAICVKDDGRRTMVAHRSANSTSYSQRQQGVGTIVEELLADVLGEDVAHSVRINNSLDTSMAPLAPTTAISRAYRYMANERQAGEYSVTSNNSEHFVKLCRYDNRPSQLQLVPRTSAAVASRQTSSQQMDDTVKTIGDIVKTTMAVGYAAYLVSQLFSPNRNSDEEDN